MITLKTSPLSGSEIFRSIVVASSATTSFCESFATGMLLLATEMLTVAVSLPPFPSITS